MLYRANPPNQHLWNGLGGKLRQQETPISCIQREVMEEARISLHPRQHLRFAGIVTWPMSSQGMYAYIADLPQEYAVWEGERNTPEGLLSWKPIHWVCDQQNASVVSNIPHFLPKMLAQPVPQEYYCHYHEGQFVELIIRPLAPYLKSDVYCKDEKTFSGE